MTREGQMMQLNSVRGTHTSAQVLPFNDPRKLESAPPTVMARGEDCYVYDEGGRRYLEMMSGLWCAGLGFDNPAITAAMTSQLETLPFYHGFLGKATRPALTLADRLARITPGSLNRVLFSSSGSEAIDTAVKIVSYYNNAIGRPEKKKIIARANAYHGSGMSSAALTAMDYCHHGFDLSQERILRTGSPNYYQHANPGEKTWEFAKRRAHELDLLIESEGPETVAAFFAEPVQASGGVVIPPDQYWPEIQKVLEKHDVLLIADEVVCGFHRTAEPFGSDRFGMQPDMMVLAKQLSAGFAPISATLITDEIYEPVADEAHRYGILGCGFTYSGHPVSAAAALAALDEYERLEFPRPVRELEPVLREELDQCAGHDGVGEARSVGLLGGLELDDAGCRELTGRSAEDCVSAVVAQAEANGVILRPVGPVIAVCPPMIARAAQLREMGQVLRDALAAAIQ